MNKLLLTLALALVPASLLFAQGTTGENIWQGDQIYKNPIEARSSNTSQPQIKAAGQVASSTGVVVNAAASATADALQVQNNGTNVVQVNPGATSVAGVVPPTIKVTVAVASSSGVVVNAASSALADIAQFNVNGSTKTKVSSTGALVPLLLRKAQIDARTPDYTGELIICADCPGPSGATGGAICVSTASAAASQYVNMSTTTVTAGVGVGAPKGCGTGG